MAATLDTIAEQPGVEAARAESLHQVIWILDISMFWTDVSDYYYYQCLGGDFPPACCLGDGSTPVQRPHSVQVAALVNFLVQLNF